MTKPKKIKSRVNPLEISEFILEQPELTLFRDEKNKPWVEFYDNGTYKVFSCNSEAFELWCRKLIYINFNINPNRDLLRNIIELLKAVALYGSNKAELYNRVRAGQFDLTYDLSNQSWEQVHIFSNGWEIIKGKEKILFKRQGHQAPQVTPKENIDPEYVKKILDYVNLTDTDQQILFLVWLISCFIPGFPHPLLYVYGPQGSAKSSISRIARELIDPSLLGVSTLPKNHEGMFQQLDHQWLSFFDNVSYIDQQMSDILSKAITGVGMSKRELYTNDEDVIYNFMRCIGINGINIEGAQPDLLERSILLKLKRMDSSQRIPEKELWSKFKDEKPKILGGIFSALSKTLSLKEAVELGDLPRMADFTLWGYAIAEAIGYDPDEFYDAYMRNINSQTEESIYANGVAVTLCEFMKDKPVWEGTMRNLYRSLSSSLFGLEGIKHIDFPKTESVLGKKLGQIEVVLGNIGIILEHKRGEQRIIKITNTKLKDDSATGMTEKVEDKEDLLSG